MYTISIWNRGSANHGTNAFVKTHGTATVQMITESAAMQYVTHLTEDPLIDNIVVEGPLGRLTWQRNAVPTVDEDVCDCYGCIHGEQCRHDEFDTCDSNYGGPSDEDDQDGFDINDCHY